MVLPDRRDHLLGHQQPLHARPAVLGAPQVPAAEDRQQEPVGRGKAGAKASGGIRADVRAARKAVGGSNGGSARTSSARPANGSKPKTDAKPGTGAKTDAKARRHTLGATDGKALAPKPGAKPINPKKGGAAKRQSG